MKKMFMKPMAAVILTLCMIMGMMPSVITVEAHDNSGGYPYNVAAGIYIADQWNFYQCECTSFVAWCLNSRNGVAFHNYYGGVYWGHAKNWGNAARTSGIAVDSNPAVGAVAWSSSGDYGHVAWVCAVNGDQVTIDEYNFGPGVFINNEWHGNHKYNTRTVHKSTFQYIHLKDISEDITAPTISDVRVTDVNSEGYTVTCRVEDAGGVARVQFPTWTTLGDQDDLMAGWWDSVNCRGTQNGTTWSYRVNASDHNNEEGFYNTHIYAWDIAGNSSGVNVNVNGIYVDRTPPVISDVQVVDMDATGYTVTCKVEDASSGISRVQFPTWTAANDQDDLAESWWDDPSCSGIQDGTTWSFRVNDKEHDFERGIYATHIYAYDDSGNTACYMVNNIVLQNTYSHVNTASYNGHTYHLYNDILTWDEAKAKCEELGGHLVTITSADEQETVAGLIQGQARSGYWIGGSSDNGSTWVTGEEFSFSNWAPGEPNADGGEDSYEIYPDGTWNDLMGSSKYLGFICEWDGKKEEHTHAYTGAWKSDAKNHWKECECGKKAEEALHEFAWMIDTAAPEEGEGIKHEECVTCGYTPTAYHVSGTVTLTGDMTATVELVDAQGTVVATQTVTGSTAEYRLENVPAGIYTLRVSQANGVVREYAIAVTDTDVSQDTQVQLLGDVNSDGTINARDKKLLFNHIEKISVLSGYLFEVGDVNGDGTINARDKKLLYNHIERIAPLW